MHPLLQEQLTKALGPNAAIPPAWQALLTEVERTYEEQEARTCAPPQVSKAGMPTEAALFKQVVEADDDAICILGSDATILYVNPSWERMTGFLRSESLGKILPMLWSEKTHLSEYQELEQCLKDRVAFESENIIHRRKDGKEYNVAVRVYPIGIAGGEQLLVVVQQDITERKLIDISKAEFVSLATHQLRTPLTSITWNLEILLDSDLGKMGENQLRTMLQSAHRSSERMAETIGTLLQLSNLEVGKIQPNFTYVELGKLLDIVRTEELPEYLKKDHNVTLDCPIDLTLFTDPTLLKEVLTNLLNNAIKYTPAKGTIVLRGTREDGRIRIDIVDNGYGIPKRQQDRVFTKFFRGDNVTYIENTGNGLGLYLVSQLVQLMRGTISFTSDENHGTTFTVSLPTDARAEAPLSPEEFVRKTSL